MDAGTTKNSKKRSRSPEVDPSKLAESDLKIAKVHPFFNNKLVKKDEKADECSFRWLNPLGSAKTCLYGVNLTPEYSRKVAAFDLDGTLIKAEFSKNFTNLQWEWWRRCVPTKLNELHESGYSIVIISNQCLKPLALKVWKEKLTTIGSALPGIPFRILAATAKDNYRKPMPGMWNQLEQIFHEASIHIGLDKSASFFVGDAAGRRYANGKTDFSSTDRKWASNVGIRFSTPEEFFLGLPPHQSIVLPGFNVSSLPVDLPLITPTSSPLTPQNFQQEIVLFVGYPCIGKTTFYRRFFEDKKYAHINQDLLKSRDKCTKAVEDSLKSGQSCVVDNTNRNTATRKLYVDIAKSFRVPIRCFVFTGSIELAWHNNLYRAYNLPSSAASKQSKRCLLPYSAFTSFRNGYEEPSLNEGYSDLKRVNWNFHGTDDEKRHWSMWLQIDGK